MAINTFPPLTAAGPRLLGYTRYAPATDTTVETAEAALTALNTTNLRCSFVAPASGRVQVVVRGAARRGAALQNLGILSGTVAVAAWPYGLSDNAAVVGTTIKDGEPFEFRSVVSGLTAGTTYSFDLAASTDAAASPAGVLAGVGHVLPNRVPVEIEVWEVS